jgi:hypothetical protein
MDHEIKMQHINPETVMQSCTMEMTDLVFGKDEKLKKKTQNPLSDDLIQSFIFKSVTRQKIFTDKCWSK